MKYHLRTHAPLCKSKGFFETHEEMLKHIAKVVKATFEFRKKMSDKDLNHENYGRKICIPDIEKGITILHLEEKTRNAAIKLLGKPSSLEDPFKYPYETKKTNRINKKQDLDKPGLCANAT